MGAVVLPAFSVFTHSDSAAPGMCHSNSGWGSPFANLSGNIPYRFMSAVCLPGDSEPGSG